MSIVYQNNIYIHTHFIHPLGCEFYTLSWCQMVSKLVRIGSVMNSLCQTLGKAIAIDGHYRLVSRPVAVGE